MKSDFCIKGFAPDFVFLFQANEKVCSKIAYWKLLLIRPRCGHSSSSSTEKHDLFISDGNWTRNLLQITVEKNATTELPKLGWRFKVRVRHMCCQWGSHDMLIMSSNERLINHQKVASLPADQKPFFRGFQLDDDLHIVRDITILPHTLSVCVVHKAYWMGEMMTEHYYETWNTLSKIRDWRELYGRCLWSRKTLNWIKPGTHYNKSVVMPSEWILSYFLFDEIIQ